MWIWRLHLTFRSCFKNLEASKPRSEGKCKFHGLVRYNFETFYLSVRCTFNYFVLCFILLSSICFDVVTATNIKCSKIKHTKFDIFKPKFPISSIKHSLIKFKQNSFPRWQHTGSMTIARLQNLSDQSTTLKRNRICGKTPQFVA